MLLCLINIIIVFYVLKIEPLINFLLESVQAYKTRLLYFKENKMKIISNINSSRNSSIELLRIVAMLFIIASHSSVHGCFPDARIIPFYNRVLLNCLTLGNIGVSIFVLISGYFLCSKKISVESIKKLHIQVIFYSFVGLLVALAFNIDVSIKDILKTCFPTIYRSYWFFTVYFILIIFTPYINIFLKNINRIQFLYCLAIMFLLWIIIPTFMKSTMYGDRISWFIMLYMFGAYIKIYPNKFMTNIKIT